MAINDNNFKQNCGGSSTTTTTSLVPQVYQGAGYIAAQANLVPNVADTILLSDGTRMETGKVIWTGHGLTVGAYYWLDQAGPGGYTAMEPTSGLVQQLFFVEDADTIHIDVEHAHDASAVAAAAHTTVLATCPASGPTIAPTAEGHYFWTSAIGEKWQWIYGDAAPFVCGDLYYQTTSQSATLPINGLTVIHTIIAPRSGVVEISSSCILGGVNPPGDFLRFGAAYLSINGSLVARLGAVNDYLYGQTHSYLEFSGSMRGLYVAAGDVIRQVVAVEQAPTVGQGTALASFDHLSVGYMR